MLPLHTHPPDSQTAPGNFPAVSPSSALVCRRRNPTTAGAAHPGKSEVAPVAPPVLSVPPNRGSSCYQFLWPAPCPSIQTVHLFPEPTPLPCTERENAHAYSECFAMPWAEISSVPKPKQTKKKHTQAEPTFNCPSMANSMWANNIKEPVSMCWTGEMWVVFKAGPDSDGWESL